MNTRFKIEVSPESNGVSGSATFIVEAGPGLLRISEVRIQPGASGVELPIELGELNFRGCITFVASLSEGRFSVGTQSGRTLEDPPLEPSGPPREAELPSEPPTVRPAKKADRPSSGMPSDLARIYWRLGGSITKVAKHYDVPRQIARDWIKDLRNENAIPG